MNQRKPALPPGSLIYVGEEMKHTIHLEGFLYRPGRLLPFDVRKIEEIPESHPDDLLWLNVNGIHRADVIESVGNHFRVPHLTLEDILNTEQRPKIDEVNDMLFIVMKMLYLHEGQIAYEHLSVILAPRMVITFQEQPWDIFGPVRKRLQQEEGRLRHQGPDYLAYALIDAVVDNYLVVMDTVEDQIESLEHEILEQSNPNSIRTLHDLQQELIFLSKAFRGTREVLSRIQRRGSGLIREATHIYLADVGDHMDYAVESLDVHRELLNSLDNLHFSLLNQKTNDVMKLLTLFASIFLPLTFVAGVYGMNFKHMPELEWLMGYPLALLVMATIAASLIVYFKRNRWL